MKKIIQNLCEKIQIHFGKTIIALSLIWVGVLVVEKPSVGMAFLQSILFLFSFEIIFRFLMLSAYGRHYPYSAYSYFLTDDPIYGYTFRKNCYSKKLDFLVFDQFVFEAGSPRFLTLEENKQKRFDFNINKLGFRGPLFSTTKKNKKLRIFCSGGSTTAGDRNNDNDTWPAHLEKVLQNKGFETEVINAGVEGWYSYQELLRLKKEIINYQPDILLVHQGWNEEFEFSSLCLGEKWRPKVVRNSREANNLYSPPSRFISQTAWFSLYLTIQSWQKNQVFIPNMRFTNPKRWEVLLKNDYIIAWFDNMIEMASLAKEKNIDMYTVDYPGLVDFLDTPYERKVYVENSRLSSWYADYQAVSKKRITHTLRETQPIIPCLGGEKAFVSIRGEPRLALFHDEIHMRPEGNQILAQNLGDELVKQESFLKKYEAKKPEEVSSNVNINFSLINEIRKNLEKNPAFLDRFIKAKIYDLESQKIDGLKSLGHVPSERYTTF